MTRPGAQEETEALEEELMAAEQAEHESSSRVEELLNVEEFMAQDEMEVNEVAQVLGKRLFPGEV